MISAEEVTSAGQLREMESEGVRVIVRQFFFAHHCLLSVEPLPGSNCLEYRIREDGPLTSTSFAKIDKTTWGGVF